MVARRTTRRLSCVALTTLLALGAALVVGSGAASANSGTITANGSTVTATVSSAGVPATFTFAGTSGEVVTVSASGGTFANTCDANLLLLDPNGNQVAEAGCVGTSGFIGETALPGAGTYSIEVDPANSDLGSVTLSLSANAANGSITMNGPAVTFTASHTGQGQEFAFTGKKQVVTVSAYSGTFPSNCDLNMELLDSSGNVLGSSGCSSQTGWIGETALEGKGTYYIDFVPQGNSIGSNTGSVTVALSEEPANATITENGAPVTVTSTHTGTGENLDFSVAAGQVVTVSAYNGTFPSNCDLSVELVLDGSVLVNGGCASTTGWIAETVLPATGTYSIELVPLGNSVGSNTGSVTVAVSAEPGNGTITPNGATTTLTSTHTGTGGNFTFKGKAGEVMEASTFDGTFPGNCDLTMLMVSPGGNVLEDSGCASQSGWSGPVTLPAKGTYTIELVPEGNNVGTNTGSVKLALSENPAAGTITANGPSQTFTATNTGQGQDFTFSGTSGETVTASTTGGTFPANCDLDIQVLSPSGSAVASSCAAQSGSTGAVKLPGTGTYTVALIPTGTNIGSNTGSVPVTLASP
jgi:large repetitive protein